MEHCLIIGFLGINSWTDIRRRQVSLASVAIFAVAGIICGCVSGKTARAMLQGLLPGVLLMVISRATRGALGMGDALLMAALGIYLGLCEAVNVLLLALFLAAFWAAVLMVVKKKKGDYEFPFVPFLFLGYVGRWLLCVI